MINARNVPKRVAVNQSDPSVEARRWPPSRLKDMPLNTEAPHQTQGKIGPTTEKMSFHDAATFAD
jgi:hypothetical protein